MTGICLGFFVKNIVRTDDNIMPHLLYYKTEMCAKLKGFYNLILCNMTANYINNVNENNAEFF